MTSTAINQRLPNESVEKALRAIELLFKPGDVIEIRALAVGRTPSHSGNISAGYFNFENRGAIASAIQQLDGRAEGIYVVLNRFNPDLLARANNRLQARLKHTTSDADIIEWRWLYIDADPVRPAGISATDAEHHAALERTAQIRSLLEGFGWPPPIFCDSGNGGHLLYLLPPLDLERAGKIVKLCLKVLAYRYSDALVKVDEATSNPARICKLYGTLTRKGDPMPERPHRRSMILDEPEYCTAVAVEALEAFIAMQDVPPHSRPRREDTPDPSGFHIDEWIAAHGLDVVKGPEPYDGGNRWILARCLFNPDHEKPAILELSNGALVYKCLHRSCKENDWKTLRRLIESNYNGPAERTHRPSLDSAATMNARASSIQDGTDLISDLCQIPSVWTLEAHLSWCVEDMIARGSVTLICAESGTGKTWFAYYIAGSVARGVPVLGHKVHSSHVLYLDGENPLYVVKQRLFDLGIPETPNLTVWGGWNSSPPVGPNHPLVIEFARETRGLIIYDSLIEFHPGSEQSSTETRAFMRHFRTLANLGATVIVLGHSGKAETAKIYRGSSDIKAAVDTAYALESTNETSKELGKLSLTCFKGRLTPGCNFGMEFQRESGFVPCEAFQRKRAVAEIITEIISENPDVNQKKIVELARVQGCSKGQIERCLKTGPWRKTKGLNNASFYNLPPQSATGEREG